MCHVILAALVQLTGYQFQVMSDANGKKGCEWVAMRWGAIIFLFLSGCQLMNYVLFF